MDETTQAELADQIGLKDGETVCPIMTGSSVLPGTVAPGGIQRVDQVGQIGGIAVVAHAKCLGPLCHWWREEYRACIIHSLCNLRVINDKM